MPVRSIMMEVTKSEYDDKEYRQDCLYEILNIANFYLLRAVQLDNGLKVLLVHKPSSSGNSKEKESSEEPASTDESLEEEELETSSDDGSGETLSESEPSEEETDCRRQRREKKVSASVRKYDYTITTQHFNSITHLPTH